MIKQCINSSITKSAIQRETLITSIPRELSVPSKTKRIVPNNPSAWITLFFQLSGFLILGVIFSGYIGSPGILDSIKGKLVLVEKALGPLSAQINEKESPIKIADLIISQKPSHAAVIKPFSPQPTKKSPDPIPITNQSVVQGSPTIEVKIAELQPLEKSANPTKRDNQLPTHITSPISESDKYPFKPRALTPRYSKQYHKVKYGETLYSISKRYGISIDEICHINSLKSTKSIKPDQNLLVKYK